MTRLRPSSDLPYGPRARLAMAVLAAVLLTTHLVLVDPAVADRNSYRIYVHAYGSDGVHGYDLTDETDATEPIPGSAQPSGSSTWPQAVSPDGRNLYLVSGGSRRLFVYAIGARGDLTPVPGAEEFVVTGTPVDFVITPDGRHGFIGSGSLMGMADGQVQPVRIERDGLLVPNGPAVMLQGPAPGLPMLTISVDGRRLYATSGQDGTVSYYGIRDDGRLTGLRGQVTAGSTPIFPTITPDGRFLYVTNERSMSISGFAVTGTGHLSELPGSPFPAGSFPHGIAFAGDGRYLYAPNALGASISGYEVAGDGRLSPLPGSPYSTGLANPEMAVTSPSGQALWVIDLLPSPLDGGVDSRLRKFWIGTDGRLAADKDAVIRTGLDFADGRTLSLVP